jgi:hypothetical protein
LIVLSPDPDTILVPSGENATDLTQLLWAFVFSLNSPSASASKASRRQIWPRRRDLRARGAPESQTLIVLSVDPETILLVPSGENATDWMVSLWAFVFSATQLMSIAIILRTRDVGIRQHGDMWDHERLQA